MALSTGDLLQLKTEILCAGTRVDPSVLDALSTKLPGLYGSGRAILGEHLLVEGIVVNTTFTTDSDYAIRPQGAGLGLFKHDRFLCDAAIVPLPEWCSEEVDGILAGRIARPHSPRVVCGVPILSCSYDERACRFCNLSHAREAHAVPPATVGHVLARALAFDPDYQVNLSGGMLETPDTTAEYFVAVCREIGRHGHPQISVELVPPSEAGWFRKLKAAGAVSVIMNLEIYDEGLRAEVCPGKSSVTRSRYFEAFAEAASVFGAGRVSSVLIAGIQPEEDIREASRQMIAVGVIPTIIPFQPLERTPLSDRARISPEELLRISRYVAELLLTSTLDPTRQRGCANCGGCSLEGLMAQVAACRPARPR